MHDAAPLSLLVPAGQSEHKLAERSLYVPEEHVVHKVRPVAEAYVPFSHASHEVDAFLLV